MAASTQWQLAHQAAEQYEQVLVPTILGPAARALVEWAAPLPGDSVLDLGCGTGAAARAAAQKAGTSGRVVGVDVNAGMIGVARSLPPVPGAALEWQEGSADALPLTDHSMDRVLCAQTLQFLPDRPAALAEVARILKPGGRLAVSLWSDLRESPYFQALIDAISKHVGAETAAGLEAAFGLSDTGEIRALLAGAGFGPIEMVVERLELELPAPETFVPTHIDATPMSAGYRAAARRDQERVVRDVAAAVEPYRMNGGVRVPFSTHLIIATCTNDRGSG